MNKLENKQIIIKLITFLPVIAYRSDQYAHRSRSTLYYANSFALTFPIMSSKNIQCVSKC